MCHVPPQPRAHRYFLCVQGQLNDVEGDQSDGIKGKPSLNLAMTWRWEIQHMLHKKNWSRSPAHAYIYIYRYVYWSIDV